MVGRHFLCNDGAPDDHAHPRKTLGMIDRCHGQIDIQIGPVKMIFAQRFHMTDLRDGGAFEPRKVLERQQFFIAFEQQPEAMRRYVRHFNGSTPNSRSSAAVSNNGRPMTPE